GPAGRERLADDRCPICTLIHLAGALVPAEMPSLPLPTVFGRLRLELAAQFDLTAAPGPLFPARPPPPAGHRSGVGPVPRKTAPIPMRRCFRRNALIVGADGGSFPSRMWACDVYP